MMWVPSYVGLGRHPKTKRLARALGVGLPAAVGHLHLFWHWAMEFAPDGDLDGVDPFDVADGAGFEGDPDAFFQALRSAGFIDSDGQIHDWEEYGGGYFKRLDASRARTAAHRARTSQLRTRDMRVRTPLEERREEESREDLTTNVVSERASAPEPIALFPETDSLASGLCAQDAQFEHNEPSKVERRKRMPKGSPPPSEFVDAMREKYRASLANVELSIEAALNHQAMLKAIDPCRYLENWLKRDAASQQSRASPGRGAQVAQFPGGAQPGTPGARSTRPVLFGAGGGR